MTKTTRKNRDFAIRGMALLVLLSFTVTSVAMPSPARAQAAELAVSPVIPVADFRIPDELGTVSARYEAPGPGSSGKAPVLTNATTTRRTVVLIQDAHAVDDAQENIRKIIGHLQSRGQADVLFVEGAQGSLDPELLRSFPDKKIRNQVMAAYLAKAELSGAESAAILNPEDGKFEGLEDWALYSENYLAFQRAQKEKDTLLAALAKFRADLDAAGSRQIPEDLAEFLSQWADFRAERISLLDLVVTIQGYPAAAKIKADFPEVAKLIETFGYERSGRQESLEPLVKTIAAEFKQKYGRTMDVREQSSFFIMYQKFLTGQASAAEMLGYLVDFGKARGQRLKMTPELKRLLGHAQTLADIRGSRLFDELNRFLPRVARSLARTSADLRTADHCAKLFILEDLASLELTHQTLSEYQKDPESYLGLMNDPDLRSRFTPAIEFYQTALRRDRVFYEKVRAVKNARSIVIIAGGFHTNGLERILKENGESYVVVTPKIASLAGAGNYFTVMAGDLSYKDYLKTTYYDALMRHAVRSLTATLKEPEFRQTIKRWRDNLIRALAAKGRIDDLGRYTRYLDDLNLVYAERFAKNLTPRTKEDILDFIRKEFVKFRAEAFDSLQRRFEGQLSKFTADIQNLTGRNQLTEASVEAVLRESGLTGRSMLGAPSAMAPENPVLGDPGIAGPEGSTIPWRNEAGAADGRDLSRLAGMGGFYIDGISSAGNVLDAANALKAAANSDRSFHEKTTAPSEVLVTLIPNGMKLIIAPRHVIDPRNVPGEPGKKHYMSHEEFSEAAGFEEQPAETVRMLLFFDHWTGNFSEMLLVPGVGQRREDVLPLFSFLRNALIKTGNPAEAVDGSLMMDPFGDGEITLGDFIGRQELRSPFPRIIQKILMAGTVAGLLAIPAITADAAPAIPPERVKMVQRELGLSNVNGVIGRETIAALEKEGNFQIKTRRTDLYPEARAVFETVERRVKARVGGKLAASKAAAKTKSVPAVAKRVARPRDLAPVKKATDEMDSQRMDELIGALKLMGIDDSEVRTNASIRSIRITILQRKFGVPETGIFDDETRARYAEENALSRAKQKAGISQDRPSGASSGPLAITVTKAGFDPVSADNPVVVELGIKEKNVGYFQKVYRGYNKYGYKLWPGQEKDVVTLAIVASILKEREPTQEEKAQLEQIRKDIARDNARRDVGQMRHGIALLEGGRNLAANQRNGIAASAEMIEARSAIDALLYAASRKDPNVRSVLYDGLTKAQRKFVDSVVAAKANNRSNRDAMWTQLQNSDFQDRMIIIYLYHRLMSAKLPLPSAGNLSQQAGTYHLTWAPGIFEYSRSLATFLYANELYELLEKLSRKETVTAKDREALRQADVFSKTIEEAAIEMRRAFLEARKNNMQKASSHLITAEEKRAALLANLGKYQLVPERYLLAWTLGEEIGHRRRDGPNVQSRGILPSEKELRDMDGGKGLPSPAMLASRRSETRSLASILASVLPEETVALTVWDYDTGAGDFIRAIYEWLRDQGYKNEIDVFGTERDETVVKPAFRDRIIRYSAEDPVGLPGRRPGSVRVIFANNLVARESGDLEAGPLAREAMKYLDPESGVLLVTIEASDAAAGRDEKVLYDLEKAGFKVLMQDVPADYPDYETVFKHSKLIVAIPPRAETRAEDKDRAAFREVGGDREWKSSVGSSAIRIRPQNDVMIETPSNKNNYRLLLLEDDRGLRIEVQRFERTPSGELIAEGSTHKRWLGPVYIGHFYRRLGDRNSFGVGDGFLLAPVHCQIDFGKDDKGFYLTISDLSYEFTSIEGQTTGLTVKWTPQPGSDSVEELRVESTSADGGSNDGDSDEGGSDDDDSGWLVDETPGTQDAYRGEDDLRDFLPDAETMPGTDKYVSIDVPAFYVRDGQLLVNESYHHPGVASRVLEKIAKDTNTVIRAEPQYAGLLARPGHEWMIGDEFVSDCFLHLVHLLHGELSPSDAVPLREFIRIYLEAMANYAAFLDAEGDPARKYVERISLENSLSRYLYFARLKMFREHPAWKLPVLYDAAVNPPVIAYRPGMNPLKCDPEVMTVLGIYKDKGAATGRKATGRRVVIDGKSTFLEPEKIVLVQWKGRTFLLYSSRTHKVGVDARVWRHSETLVMGWMLKHMNDPAYPQNVDDLPPQLGVRLDTVIDEHADDMRGKDEFLAAANRLDVLAFPYWNDLEKIFLGEADQVPSPARNSPQLGRARKYLASAAQSDNGQPVGDPWLGGDNKTKFQIKFYSRVLFGNMLEVTLKANGVTVFRDVFAPAHYKGPIILGRSVTNPYGILDSLAKVSGFADETRRPELLKHLSDILAAARISREHIRITWSGSRWQFENISRYDKKLTFARAETRGVYGQPLDEYIRTAPSADYSETVLSDPSEVVRLANEARDEIIKIGYSEPADPIAASFFANYLDPKRAAVFQGRDVTLTIFRMMPGTGLGRILERQLAFSEQGLYPFVVENAKGELVGHGYLTVFNYQPDQMRFRFSIHGSAGIPGPKEFAGRGYGTAVIALLGLIADRNTFLGRQMNSLGYLSAPEDFGRHGNLESMRDFLVRRGFTDETEEPLDPRLIFRIRPDQPLWFRSESRTIAQQIISSGSDAGSEILRERAEQRMSEIKGTMDVRFRELEAELAKYETAEALKSYIQSDPFREFMEQKFGEFPGIGILISDIIAYASGIEAVAPYHVDAGIIRVVPVEIAKLIKTLSLIGHESSLTVGLRAPAKGFDSEFMKMFLEVLAQRGVVNEVAVSGQLNGYQKQLTALKIATRSVRRLGDPFIPRNSQNAVPMIMNTDDRSVVDLLNEIFSPVMSDAEEVADPYVREFTNVLKIVAAIHIADLSKRIKDPGMLKAELLKRLNIAERTELQNLIRMDASGRGFTVSSAVVRIFLRMRAEESIAQAA